jgi:sugar O-acyltransferase (sialic acid O-acetyltransferase NeuD family)
MREIVILGGGRYAAPMIELAIACGVTPTGIYVFENARREENILGIPIRGTFTELYDTNITGMNVAIAIGNVNYRHNHFERIKNAGGLLPNLVHPSAYISNSAIIGEGTYIQPHAIIWSQTLIGDSVVISPSSMVSHHSVVGSGCLVSTLSSIGTGVTIGEKVFVGMGSTIMTGVKMIGSNSVIGAGSVVIHDVDAGTVVAGVPAKTLKK